MAVAYPSSLSLAKVPPSSLIWRAVTENRSISRSSDMPLQVLLVEDNLGDIRLPREALVASNIFLNLHVATDGVDAMAFLRREVSISTLPVRILFCSTLISQRWMAGKF